MKKDSLSKIAHQIFPGSSIVRQCPLKGGVSASMYALEVKKTNGEKHCIVIRQHGAATWKSLENNVTSTEFDLLRVLFNKGLKVPEPLFLDNSGTILSSPYLVTEFIDGTSSVPLQDLDSHLYQMAHFLNHLHCLDLISIELPELPIIEDPVQGAMQYLPMVSEDKSVLSIIEQIKANTECRSLLHGDFWPGNIMWKNGQLAAVLDWEDSNLGNPMADLAGCRVELLVKYGREAMDIFTNYYFNSNPQEFPDLRLWEIYSSSAALATLPNWGLPPDVEAHRKKMTTVFLKEAISNLLSQK